jgi:hypothetical protein
VLASNFDHPDLYFLSNWDYRLELPHPAPEAAHFLRASLENYTLL